MIVNRLMRSRLQPFRQYTIASQQTRSFGGGHGGDPNHTYVYIDSKNPEGHRSKLKVPSKHDIEYQNPLVGTRNEWFHMWLAGRWDPTKDEKLENSKDNKFSMYYLFRTNPL